MHTGMPKGKIGCFKEPTGQGVPGHTNVIGRWPASCDNGVHVRDEPLFGAMVVNRRLFSELNIRLVLLLLVIVAGGAASARAAENMPIALKGYDPVAYFTLSRAVRGDARFQMEWDGAVYRFVSAHHLELFKADPDRYLPQFGNLCTASLASGKRRIPDPRYWLVHQGRLFLFAHPDGVKMMAVNPDAMMARANANLGGRLLSH